MQIVNLDHGYINSLIVFMEKNKSDSHFFNPHKFDEESIRKIIKEKKKDEFLIVLIDGLIIAYLMLRGLDEGYSTPSLGIAIDRRYRGLGLSKLFVQHLECICKIKGCSDIMLTVKKDNKTAINLYEKIGYILENLDENSYIGKKTL